MIESVHEDFEAFEFQFRRAPLGIEKIGDAIDVEIKRWPMLTTVFVRPRVQDESDGEGFVCSAERLPDPT